MLPPGVLATTRGTSSVIAEKGEFDMKYKKVTTIIIWAIFLAILLAPYQLFAQQKKPQTQQAAPGGKQVQKDIAKPINCATAEGDIRVLQSEKAHTSDQIAKGVMSISPAGIVLGLVSGTSKENAQIATGDYNKMIDKKIAEIKETCGIK